MKTKPTILIIDDEASIRFILSMILKKSYDTLEARTIKEALEIIQEVHPPLILLDNHFKGFKQKGIHAIHDIKMISPNSVVTLISADVPDLLDKPELMNDFFAMVEKPFDTIKILKVVGAMAQALEK